MSFVVVCGRRSCALPFKLLNVEPPEVVARNIPLQSWGLNDPSLTRSTVSFVQVVVQVETSKYDHVTLGCVFGFVMVRASQLKVIFTHNAEFPSMSSQPLVKDNSFAALIKWLTQYQIAPLKSVLVNKSPYHTPEPPSLLHHFLSTPGRRFQ